MSSFLWAAERAVEGKKLRRSTWGSEQYVFYRSGPAELCTSGNKALKAVDILADDWMLVQSSAAYYAEKQAAWMRKTAEKMLEILEELKSR